MAEKNATLYLVTQGDTEYIAIVTDPGFAKELKSDYVVIGIKPLDGDFSSWPTNRLMVQE